MNEDCELEKLVVYSVAHLQEFYDKADMLKFYRACDEQECDVGAAFLAIDNELKRVLSSVGLIPSFYELAGNYAELRGWKFVNSVESRNG